VPTGDKPLPTSQPHFVPRQIAAPVASAVDSAQKVSRISTAPHLSLNELRDPRERTTFLILVLLSIPVWLLIICGTVFSFGVALVPMAVLWLVVKLGQLFAAAYIKTNAVRVSPTQLPQLHEIVEASCSRLQMSPPDVYVFQYNLFNAFAAKLAGRRFVILLSGAIDPLLINGDYDQLAFIVGHELGQHVAGNLDFFHGMCPIFGAWLPWFHFWYHRRSELTCDRIGLYCTGKLEPAIKAMVKMTVGAQLAKEISVDDAIRQWEQHRREFFVRYRTIYSTHPHQLWRLAQLNDAAREFGIA
jgi:Zn-dependent protease with chaperone function